MSIFYIYLNKNIHYGRGEFSTALDFAGCPRMRKRIKVLEKSTHLTHFARKFKVVREMQGKVIKIGED